LPSAIPPVRAGRTTRCGPLDALWGARGDAVEIGQEAVRGVATTRCRLTVDLARADAALPAGVSVPAGPYRALTRMPAEVWLDAAGLARRVAVSPGLAKGMDGRRGDLLNPVNRHCRSRFMTRCTPSGWRRPAQRGENDHPGAAPPAAALLLIRMVHKINTASTEENHGVHVPSARRAA
jgi:hypothetical protein